MEYNLRITDIALDDMEAIHTHIADVLLEPQTALRMIDLLEESIAKLPHMPHSRPIVADARLSLAGYRKLFVKNYIVFFTTGDKTRVINIERILHSRRDWQSML